MTMFNSRRRRTTPAAIARERLQILLAHERSMSGQSDLITLLSDEILAAVARHVRVERDRVQVKMDRGDAVSTLEVEIEIPNPTPVSRA